MTCTGGGKPEFTKPKVTSEVVTSVEYLHVLILECERYWALAQQLRDEWEEDDEAKKLRLMKKKLKRAQSVASELMAVCSEESSVVDAATTCETVAYVATMDGLMQQAADTNDMYAKALASFSVAYLVYHVMIQVMSQQPSTSKKQSLQIGVYRATLSEIGPRIRYCAYRLGDSIILDEDSVVEKEIGQVLGQSKLDEIKTLLTTAFGKEAMGQVEEQIYWRGKEVAVPYATLLKAIHAADYEEMDVEAIKKDLGNWQTVQDEHLVAWRKANRIAASLVEMDQAVVVKRIRSNATEAHSKRLQFIADFVAYRTMQHTVWHDVEKAVWLAQQKHVKSGKRLRSPSWKVMLKLTTRAMQTVQRALALETVKDDPVLVQHVEACLKVIQAVHAVHMAQQAHAAKQVHVVTEYVQQALEAIQEAVFEDAVEIEEEGDEMVLEWSVHVKYVKDAVKALGAPAPEPEEEEEEEEVKPSRVSGFFGGWFGSK